MDNQLEIIGKIKQFQSHYTGGWINIGGWAIWAHTGSGQPHDVDAMVDVTTVAELRDYYALTKDHKLKKDHFTVNGLFEVDIYIEKQHGMSVPYDEIKAYSRELGGLVVPCAEHLLIMKKDAVLSRGNTPKGVKDVGDIVQLVTKAEFKSTEILWRYFSITDWEILKGLAEDNSQTAYSLTQQFSRALSDIENRAINHEQFKLGDEEKEGISEKTLRLDLFCEANGITYPVHTSNPTLFELVLGNQDKVIKNYSSGVWTIVSERDLSPVEVLRILAWRAHCWDAREVWSRYRKILPLGGMEQNDEIF